MPIRDNAEAERLLAKIDQEQLRRDVGRWLAGALNGKKRDDLSASELEATFAQVSPHVQKEYGFDIWDAMVLMNVAEQEVSNNPPGFEDWRRLYDCLSQRAQEMKIQATLQEDYDGVETIHVWCPQDDFQRFVTGIEEAMPVLTIPFKVVIVECKGDDTTGRTHTFTIAG